MTETCLSSLELASRWNMGDKTLSRWRQDGRGPTYLKLGKSVRYRLVDVIEYEETMLKRSAPIPIRVPIDEPVVRADGFLTIQDVVAGLRSPK
jgi:hypothetical protein